MIDEHGYCEHRRYVGFADDGRMCWMCEEGISAEAWRDTHAQHMRRQSGLMLEVYTALLRGWSVDNTMRIRHHTAWSGIRAKALIDEVARQNIGSPASRYQNNPNYIRINNDYPGSK